MFLGLKRIDELKFYKSLCQELGDAICEFIENLRVFFFSIGKLSTKKFATFYIIVDSL